MGHLEYDPATGRLYAYNGPGDPVWSVSGYAGHGAGLNNPELSHVPRVGPLPEGCYRIGRPERHPRLGPMALPLKPFRNALFGRSGFYIHGDNRKGDKSASQGCIVVGPENMVMIWIH